MNGVALKNRFLGMKRKISPRRPARGHADPIQRGQSQKLNHVKILHSLAGRLCSAGFSLSRLVAFPLFFLAAGLVLVQPCAGGPFNFSYTGSGVILERSTTDRRVEVAVDVV